MRADGHLTVRPQAFEEAATTYRYEMRFAYSTEDDVRTGEARSISCQLGAVCACLLRGEKALSNRPTTPVWLAAYKAKGGSKVEVYKPPRFVADK